MKPAAMLVVGLVFLWFVAVGFTKLAAMSGGGTGTPMDRSECGSGAWKYDC